MKFTIYSSDHKGNPKNKLYPHKCVITAEADLKKCCTYDHVCAEYKDNIRSDANYITSDVAPMDCDNDHSDNPEDWITPEILMNSLTDVQFAVIYSRNNDKQKGTRSPRPRFHVLFPIVPCNDPTSYKAVKKRIYKEFSFFDGNALDASRFLFGSASDVLWHEGGLTIDKYLMLMKSSRSIPEGQRNATLSRRAGKIVIRFGAGEDAHNKFLEEAGKCEPPLDDDELNTIWRSACKFGSKVSSQQGYISPEEWNKQPAFPSDFSDVGEARTLVSSFGDELIYTDATDYLRFNNTYWEESEQSAVLAMIEHTDNQLALAERLRKKYIDEMINCGINFEDAVKGGKKFISSLNETQLEAYERFAYIEKFKSFVMKYRNVRSLCNALDTAKPFVLKDQKELDRDAFLLNTPGGTYYLPDGLDGWRPTDPKDYITKVTAVVPDNTGEDIWLDALNVFFCKNQELIDYVQLICGLCILGKVFVESMIIAYGDGRNGKSTFWNVLYNVLGSYSGNISADALTVNCKRNVKPEMAELKGKRIIIAAELQEGMRLNTSVVKQLCSTDPIFAEKKFKAPFSFEPSHTLVLYTNHLPKVSASDDGTWRRLIVIPFDAKIKGSDDKKNYTQYIIDHAGGAVLKWLIEGAKKVIDADYQIDRPECVLEAIGAYRECNDWLGNFISDCCETDKGFEEKSGELYKKYREYCSTNGEFARGTSDFYGALEQAGYKKRKKKEGNYIMGLRMRFDFLD